MVLVALHEALAVALGRRPSNTGTTHRALSETTRADPLKPRLLGLSHLLTPFLGAHLDESGRDVAYRIGTEVFRPRHSLVQVAGGVALDVTIRGCVPHTGTS